MPPLPGTTVPTRASGYFGAHLHVGRAAHHFEQLPGAVVDAVEGEARLGDALAVDHLSDHERREVGAQRLDPSRVATCVLSSCPMSAAVRPCGTKARSQSCETIIG
jgi:hypothetical protein